jgi:ketosteroid isomerase-like protein
MACQPPVPEAGGLSDEDVAAIRSTIDSFVRANLASDWAAAAALFTEDAVRMPSNRPMIVGRTAILARMEAEALTFTQWRNTPLEVDGRGDLAYVRGTYSLTVAGEGMPQVVGKYVWILRQQPDGSWRAVTDIWNWDVAPRSEP